MAQAAPSRPPRMMNAPGAKKNQEADKSASKAKDSPTKPATTKAAAPKKKKGSKTAERQAKWSGDQLGKSVSQALVSALGESAKEFGDDTICVAGKVGRLVIGIPLPSLCWEILLENNVLRLGIVIQILGMEGCCKSGLCFEIVRWFANSQGAGSLIENEDKFDPNWAKAVIGDFGREVLGYLEASSLEDAQTRLLDQFKRFKWIQDGVSKKEPGSGRVFPVLFLLDSLMGKPSEETMRGIHEAGFASRAHPVEALKLTPYLKTIATEMKGWPFLFIFTNHLKMGQDAQGKPQRRKAGGALKDFQETMELEMKKIGKNKTNSYSDLNLQIECRKNSMGETGNRMLVTIRTMRDKTTRKKTARWLWHAATIHHLFNYPAKGEIGEKIRAVFDFHKLADDKWWSKTLGVKKSEPVDAEELGALLHQRQDLVDQLRDIFGIQRRKVFEPGRCYKQQRKELKQVIDQEMEKL